MTDWTARLAAHAEWLADHERGAQLALPGADLRGLRLPGADLSGANLEGADLAGADLSGARLAGAVLYGAELPEAVLTDADLTGADLVRTFAAGARLEGARLAGADLRKADLTRARLPHAVLRRADCADADFYGADLTGADFTRAHLVVASLIRADAAGARFDEADIDQLAVDDSRFDASAVGGAAGAVSPFAGTVALVGDGAERAVSLAEFLDALTRHGATVSTWTPGVPPPNRRRGDGPAARLSAPTAQQEVPACRIPIRTPTPRPPSGPHWSARSRASRPAPTTPTPIAAPPGTPTPRAAGGSSGASRAADARLKRPGRRPRRASRCGAGTTSSPSRWA